MILCEDCDEPYHINCIQSKPLILTSWVCCKCIATGHDDYGFEDSDPLTLADFQDKADAFKIIHFESSSTTELQIEEEFWNIVGCPFKEVKVEYGADLHTSIHGSGFPTLKSDPQNSYSRHPWNLNNTSLLPGCLLQNIKTDISGMMIPWIYVGMIFSTFCWHAEDHFV